MPEQLNYLSQLIGMDAPDAEDWLRELGITYRIVSSDHISYMLTCDCKHDRVNLKLFHGMVSEAYYG